MTGYTNMHIYIYYMYDMGTISENAYQLLIQDFWCKISKRTFEAPPTNILHIDWKIRLIWQWKFKSF